MAGFEPTALAAEDGLSDTIRPRLDACGADASRVHVRAQRLRVCARTAM